MKQTLLDIQRAYAVAMEEHRGEPTPIELGEIVKRGLPEAGALRDRYCRQMGVFVGQALNGLVIDPQRWDPPS